MTVTDAVPLLVSLLTVHHLVSDALETAMKARCGIGSSHFEVLLALSRAPDGQLRMVDIAAKNCRKSSASCAMSAT